MAGSLTVRLDDTFRVTIDNNLSALAAVVYHPVDGPPTVTLYNYLTEVLTLTGKEAAELFVPQTLSERYPNIKDYVIGPTGKLTVDGKDVSVSTVGFPVDAGNPCQKTSALIVSAESVEKLVAAGTTKDALRKAQFAKGDRRGDLLNEIVLKITQDSIVGLDPVKGVAWTISEVKSSRGETICEARTIDVQL